MHIVLISTYELGHQPFGLASPAAWLKAAGAQVACLDLAMESLCPKAIAAAELVAFYLPMHTATRLAAAEIPTIRQINPRAHICCYGLYAPINEMFLRKLGVATILGGELETGLVALFRRLAATSSGPARLPAPTLPQVEPRVLLDRQRFIAPDRSGLPGLSAYAYVQLPDGAQRTSGYTEASRGCKHQCRHC
ncbi:MAG: radical SAM protein, partial [Chloroflexales bacterium]|nr:radical SAM protein [Chloroflexales bacterium]